MARAAQSLGRKALHEISTLVSPDTLLRWYHQAVRNKWDYSHKRKPGRPRTSLEIESFILHWAQDNPGWGYTSLHKALKSNHFKASDTTIAKILKKHGLAPSPHRKQQGPSWKEFTLSHWEALVGCNFFTWEILTPFGLVTHYVFFFIRHRTRQVHIASITTHPHERWMMQIARNLTMSDWGFLKKGLMVLHDRDKKLCAAYRRILQNEGIQTLMIPFQSPNLNAYAERWVKSVKEECLAKMIILSEPMLRRILKEYLEHYHTERNHQGLNQIPFPSPELARGSPQGKVIRHQRLGGLLNFYYREAA